MISKLLSVPLFIAAGALAHPAVRRDNTIPTISQWSNAGLEPYWGFKVRYQSLDCADQVGSDFYNSCCYPLQAGQSASGDCVPTTLSCTASGPYTTTTTTTPAVSTPSDTGATTQSDDSEYCDDDGDYEDDTYDTSSTTTTTTTTDNTDYNQSTDNSGSANNSGSTDNSGSVDNSGSTDNSNNNSGGTDTSNNNSGGGGGDNTGGHGTYYYQGGNAGACGNYHGDYDLIGAIDQAWYGDLGQQSQYCGRSVRITNTDNGKSVDIVVADVCPTCDNNNSFDLSVGAFSAIADLSAGLIPISWSFI